MIVIGRLVAWTQEECAVVISQHFVQDIQKERCKCCKYLGKYSYIAVQENIVVYLNVRNKTASRVHKIICFLYRFHITVSVQIIFCALYNNY